MRRRTTATQQRQRGIAAVEFAIFLPIMLIMLALPLYFGRILWHYTAIQKSAYDAARYFSSIPRSEMKDPSKVSAARDFALSIIAAETAELNPGPYPASKLVLCDGGQCSGWTIPTTVTVEVQIYVTDIFLPGITSGLAGLDSNHPLIASVTFAYVGI